MLNIKEIIQREEYSWLKEYEDRLCILVIGGSHGYGTNTPTSDIDIRGVMLPTKEELIGLKTFEQREDKATDTVVYEINKYIKLISNTNPNTVEIIGSHPEMTLVFNDIGLNLIKNSDKFISQNCINSFGGYANAQMRRALNALSHDEYSDIEKENHLLTTLQVMRSRNIADNQRFADKLDVIIHDNELNVDIKEGKYSLRELTAALNEFNTVAKSFDKLNHRSQKKDELHLSKHIMHLTRLYLMLIDILEGKGVNTYREKDIPYLMAIRNGEIDFRDKDGEFWNNIRSMEEKVKVLKQTTSIRTKPDMRWIEHFVIETNEAVVKNSVKNYKEPLLLSELQ